MKFLLKSSKKLIYGIIGVLLISIYLAQFIPREFSHTSNITDIPKNIKSIESLEMSDLKDLPFIVGVTNNPNTLDPVDAYDGNSINVINQVCEGLFSNNLSNPNLPRINNLAESYWWKNSTTLHLKLREGVQFHDDTPFNATAAKWNLDRINYLTNSTGMLPSHMEQASPNGLWKFSNGTGIMKQIDEVNEYNITIHLNGPYSPFLDLLSFSGAAMISPSYHSQTDYIDIADDLVGTGPFEYDHYTEDVEVSFHAFDDYWRGMANITEIEFQIIPSSTDRNDAMGAHEIDYLVSYSSAYLDSFDADPSITVKRFTDDTGIPSLTYNFLGMNNEHINHTWRKAISYALDYNYIINEMLSSDYIRANSPISPGFASAYNDTVTAANLDLAIARQTLVDAGVAVGYPVNSDPNDSYWLSHPIIALNYTLIDFQTGFRRDLYYALTTWLSRIGIQVVEASVDYTEFVTRLFGEFNKLELYYIGWAPDYVEPYSMFGPLFDPISSYNTAQVNDTWLNTKMSEVLGTHNDFLRDDIYKSIQSYMAEVLYPHCFISHPKIISVHSARLSNVPYNAFQQLSFYPCEWTARPFEIVLPMDDTGFGDVPPVFSLKMYLSSYDTIWYTLDDGTTNITCGLMGQIDGTLWSGLSDDEYILRFYVNNSAGDIGTDEVVIYKDSIDPVVVIYDPEADTLFGDDAPSYNVTMSDDYLNEMFYSFDGGTHTYSLSSMTGVISEAVWDSLADGDLTLTFLASDDAGNLGYASVDIVKDSQGPVILINSPTDNNVYGVNAPSYDVTITDDHLSQMWYSIDDGANLYYFTESTGSINQTTWEALAQGEITITFYAVDTLGHSTSESVVIVKSISEELDPLTLTIIVSTVIGGVVVVSLVFIFMKKRSKA